MKNPVILDHDLQKAFPDLLKFDSTKEMEASEIYRRIRPEVERILNSVVQENLSEPPAVAGGLTLAVESFASMFRFSKLKPSATADGSDLLVV